MVKRLINLSVKNQTEKGNQRSTVIKVGLNQWEKVGLSRPPHEDREINANTFEEDIII